VSKKIVARLGKRFVEQALFWGRKTFVERRLDSRRHSTLLSWATYSPWLIDQNFQHTYDSVRGHTLVDRYRCYELWHLLAQTRQLAGDILEVGTWRGGTGCLLAQRASELELAGTVHLCDTFSGVVKSGERDTGYGGGEHADTSVAVVEQLIASMKLRNVEIHKGIFPDETGDALADRSFRFCHIDVDVYQSGKEVLDWVWPRLPGGGLVVFDDFGFPSCAGITQLVHEEEQKPDRTCIQNLNGHAVLVKTGCASG